MQWYRIYTVGDWPNMGNKRQERDNLQGNGGSELCGVNAN